MKISILIDNTAGGTFLAEHGLSYLIEHDGRKILFDTGHSDAYIKNAAKMGIGLQKEVDSIVLSHGHWDHGNGLKYLQNKKLITHPDAFMKRYRKNGHTNIGLALSRDEIIKRFDLAETAQPYKITDNIIYLGGVERVNGFEARSTTFKDENNNEDYVPDDSALVLVQNNALYVVSGCAHSGICNTIEHACKVTGLNNVELVIGGFHLKYNDEQTRQTIAYFKNKKIDRVYPSHCTEMPALAAFHYELKTKQVKTGMQLIV